MLDVVSQPILAVSFSNLPEQLALGLLLGSIYALIALGYTMVYGVLRLINFAHSEVFMLGGYTTLFVTYGWGFTQANLGVNDLNGTIGHLFVMLITAMVVCGLVGVIIERLAYRPMRNQPRVVTLITAIGVSLFLQYGGQLFLPASPPPTISEKINPLRGSIPVILKGAPNELHAQVSALQDKVDTSKIAFDEQLKVEKSRFELSPRGKEIRNEMQSAEADLRKVTDKINSAEVKINLPKGQLIMFGTAMMLMFLLDRLVNKTKIGRGMRAASHDFDSAALMGVNINRIVTFTFFIGSSLAGAAAMMHSTFMGPALTPFYAVNLGVKAFVAAVLGGIGNIRGALLGGLIMGVAENTVVWLGGDRYRDAIAFVILILLLIFKPGGILGSAAVEKV